MFAKRSTALVLFWALSTTPTLALPRASSNATIPASARQFSESETVAMLQGINVLANAQISVRDAIQIAEKRTPGAKAIEVSFDGRADRLAYRVKTYWQNEVWEGTVDASTGKIVGEGIVTSFSRLLAIDRIELADFRTAGIDLSDAVSIAEKYGEGKAVSTGLEEEDGRLIFFVVVVGHGALKQISVDPNE
jgi:uncharacterized membrane protein YkoI